MDQLFNFRTVSLVTLSVGPGTQFLSSNVNRRTVIIVTETGNIMYIANKAIASFADAFCVGGNSTTLVMPYRDYGPLIQGEIWLLSSAAGKICAVTEVFKIPQ